MIYRLCFSNDCRASVHSLSYFFEDVLLYLVGNIFFYFSLFYTMLLQLFFTFLKIGAFTFGGGYAMISLIQREVVFAHGWLTQQEFTDILALSQLTPGPIGINTATFTGYSAMIHAGYAPGWGVVGAVVASLAVIMIPVLLMLIVIRWLLHHYKSPVVRSILQVLRIVVIGIIASAAVALLNVDSFGRVGWNRQFVASMAIFVSVFLLSVLKTVRFTLLGREVCLRRVSPIILLLASGLMGLLVYM
mgnify:CR=1 FL=1